MTPPSERDSIIAGYAARIGEVFAQRDDTFYLERVAANKPSAVLKAKKATAKAFQYQADGLCFSLVNTFSMPSKPENGCA